MSTNQLRNVVAKAEKKDFPAMLQAHLGEVQRALPRHMSADRIARIALTAFRRTPKLAECDPRSVFAAVIQAAQLGLEPDTLGRSYLIPYGAECNFVPGWKGLVDLVNRTGAATAWTGAVFEGDEFEYQLGDSPKVMHRPRGNDAPETMRYAYAIGRVNGADWPTVEVWSNARLLRHRDRYNKVGKRHYSFQNWEMYARKVVLLQVLKYLPMSPELITAIDLEHQSELGGQGLTIEGVASDSYVPPEIDVTPPPADVPDGDPSQAMPGDAA